MEVLNLSQVSHVGTFNQAHKKSYSYEGDGLSVSLHPDEWRRIARIGGETHLLTKDGAQFADFHSMDLDSLDVWGVENQLIEQATFFRITYFDDEMGSDVYTDYVDPVEAQEELDCMEDPALSVEEVKGYNPTAKMHSEMGVNTDHSEYQKHLFGLYIQQNFPELDGVWFADTLDVLAYSAPAGMIFTNKLTQWKIHKKEGSK